MTDGGRDPELERLRAALYGPGAPPEATERYRAALAAVSASAEPVEPGTSPAPGPLDAAGRPAALLTLRPRLRAALVAGALLLAAVAAALLLAPHPEPAPPAPTAGPAIWSGHGTSAASSPELDGRGGPLLVRLSCRGQGRVLLAVDGRVRTLTCTPGRRLQDDQYFDGAHDRFLLSMSLVGHPEWQASVHRVRLSG